MEIANKFWQLLLTALISLNRSITITNIFTFCGVPISCVNDSQNGTNFKPVLVHCLVLMVLTIMNIIRFLLTFVCHDPSCSYWLHDYSVIAKDGSPMLLIV